MLKGISLLLPPELLKLMMEMGHGDTLVIGDANFPAASCAKNLVRCDGHSGTDVLKAIIQLFPLDENKNEPVMVMQTDDGSIPPIWKEYTEIITREEREIPVTQVERFAFYELAKKAHVIVSTGEKALYANLILKKGVL